MNTRPDRRDTRWEEHRQQRRAQLVDAAIAAVHRHGAGAGMEHVAAEAGTSKTVVYRHFADRTELYLAVCARMAETLAGQVQVAMAEATGPHATLAAGIDAYLRLIESDPELYRFVVHRPLVDRALTADPVADLTWLIGDRVTAVIADQLARSGADTAAAPPWGHGVVGLVRAAADNWLARPSGMSREALAAHLTDLAWSGLSGLAVPKETS